MNSGHANLRILIVDDHPLIRTGTRAALMEQLPGAVIEEASSASEALGRIEAAPPQIILLDVNLPDMNGLDLTKRIRATDKSARVLMFAAETDPWTIFEALEAGAQGFVAKPNPAAVLARAILAVMAGQTFLCKDSRAALALAEQNSLPIPPGPTVLSHREIEVLRYLAHGENTKSIAVVLGISAKTVETHRQHIFHKLGLQGVAALTRYAIRHHLIQA